MRAAIYCRVSTEDQEREGTSLDSQKEACLAKAQELGYEVSEDCVFIETYSGLSADRPQLAKLRNKAKNGEIGAIVVLKPDRLSRVGEDILVLAKEFKLEGVKLVFVKEQWDDTLQGKLVAFMLGWAAEMYVASTVEATTRAKSRLVENGVLPQGTGIGLYGYKWDNKRKRRIPLPYEAKVVVKIFTMIGEGASYFRVAKTLNDQSVPTKSGKKWHPLTIRRIASNPAYMGLTYFGKTRGSRKTTFTTRPKEEWKSLPDVTPPIISKELFDQAQRAIQRARELRSGNPQHEYLLTGHIVCAECRSPVVGACLSRKHRYYRCRGTRPTAIRGQICHARYIRADNVEGIVWQKVKEVLENPDIIMAELQRQISVQQNQAGDKLSLDREIEKLRRKLRTYDSEEKRLIALLRYSEVTADYVLDEVNRLKKDREADQEELARLCQTKDRLAKLVKAEIKLNEFCQRVRQNLDQCDIQDKRLALDALDIRVTASPEQLDIRGAIPIDLTTTQTSADVTTIEQTSA